MIVKVEERVLFAGVTRLVQPAHLRTSPSGLIPRPAQALRAALFLAALVCFAYPASAQAPQADIPAEIQGLAASATDARNQGDIPAAIQLYRQALATDPLWLDGWWLLGNLEYGTDQYEQARSALTHYIDLSPNAAAALALRGLCAFETGAYDASLKDIQQALALGAANQPRNGQILLYHEALLLTRLGRFDEAVAKYTVFIKQGIVNSDVATGIALAGLRMPLLPQAIDPADAPLVSMTGQAAIQALTGEIPAARQAFQAVLTAFPARPYVHYFCGYLLFTRSPDQAVEEFKLELAVHPSSAVAHAMLAWAAELRGEYANALPNARAAAAEDPGLPMSQLVLGRALVETEDTSGAVVPLSRVVEADPGNLEAHLSLAKAYSKLGRKDDASRERQLCLKLAGEGTVASPNR